MVIKTGNMVWDAVLNEFQSRARDRIRTGQSYSRDALLADAIASQRQNPVFSFRNVREEFRMDNPELLAWCDKIVLSLQKSAKVSQIRSTAALARVEEFTEKNGFQFSYSVHPSHLQLYLPLPTGQNLRVKLSFKKIEDGEYEQPLLSAYWSLCELTRTCGRVVVKWN